jgi:hypothetical protein
MVVYIQACSHRWRTHTHTHTQRTHNTHTTHTSRLPWPAALRRPRPFFGTKQFSPPAPPRKRGGLFYWIWRGRALSARVRHRLRSISQILRARQTASHGVSLHHRLLCSCRCRSCMRWDLTLKFSPAPCISPRTSAGPCGGVVDHPTASPTQKDPSFQLSLSPSSLCRHCEIERCWNLSSTTALCQDAHPRAERLPVFALRPPPRS